MKMFNRFSWVSVLGGIALCFVLFSFRVMPGAHNVKVYFDSKLVLEQYVTYKTEAPKLLLNIGEKYNQVIVKYSECGRTVTGRKLTIKDDQNNVLKEYKFEGSSAGFDKSMDCPVKDLVTLKQKSNSLKLYYSSNEFSEGQHIANLVISGDAKAAVNK